MTLKANTSKMGKIIAYIRASTDKQDLNNQKLEILEYARQNKLTVDEFIEITVSSRKTSKQRRLDELLQKLADSDTLIVTELSRLGRSTSEVIALVNELVQRNVRTIIIKQNLDIAKHDMSSGCCQGDLVHPSMVFSDWHRQMDKIKLIEQL